MTLLPTEENALATHIRTMRALLSSAIAAVLAQAGLAQAPIPGPAPAGRATLLRMAAGTVDTSRLAALRVGTDQIRGNERVVVQFDAPLTAAQRNDLALAGISLGDYLPDNAYVARIRPGAVVGAPHVRWTGRIAPSWKRSPTIGEAEFSTPERRALRAAGKAAVTVALFADADAVEVAEVLEKVRITPGAQVFARELIGRNISINAVIPRSAIAALIELDAVQYVEDAPELTERNITTRWIVQSNTPGLTPLYSNGLTGSGQIIGVVDSRPDFNHCSFSDPNPIGPSHRKILAYNTGTFSFASHGTHVAGIACGDAGVEDETRGVAYAARFVYTPTPSFNEEGITTVFNLHHAQGARIHTNSYGNDNTTQYDSFCRGIDAFSYSNEDSLVLFASTNQAVLKNPENCKNAIAVGATQNAPLQASFCSGGMGPTGDGRRKPEVFAPGCDIQSSLVNSACLTQGLSGTSMATPAVAGIAALVRQYFTDGYYPSGAPVASDAFTPSGALIKAVVLNSATDMLGFAVAPPNNNEGWGRVLADASLYFPGDGSRLFIEDVRNAGGLTTGGVNERVFTVAAGTQPLRVTLVWTEPAAAAGAAAASINNLDLEIIAPGGTVYKGNTFDSGESVPGGTADLVNNVEQARVVSPSTGLWTARIKGTAVNVGTQGYALVVTGAVDVPPTPAQIFANTPAPSLVPPDVHHQFTVTVLPGGETIVPGSERVFWRRAPSDVFSAGPLLPLGGTQFRATLPRFACTDSPEYYVGVTTSLSGAITGPPDAPSAESLPVVVGVPVQTTLLDEGFEAGLPLGATTSGLWHVTAACAQASPCDGANWAYFGFDSSCTYNSSIRQLGVLSMPVLNLPPVTAGERITLTYCMALAREQTGGGFDVAKVQVNGQTVDQPTADTSGWITRSADVTAFAGQQATITFSFDTVDGFVNNFLGWQIDRVRVTINRIECTSPAPCQADLSGDRAVNTTDLTQLLVRFGQLVESFSTGDINGDGTVNTTDLTLLLVAFGQPCP